MAVVVEHTKHGAVGHRVVVEFSGLLDIPHEELKAEAEIVARRHCAKVDAFPMKQLASQAMRGQPDPSGQTKRYPTWVRVIKRPAGHPWNEEQKIRERSRAT